MNSIRAYVLAEFRLTPVQKMKSSIEHKTHSRRTSWTPETPKVGDGAAYGSTKMATQTEPEKEVSSAQRRPVVKPIR